ncbi:MAG: hypothetical protein MMC33_003214 [Icmadophila ericetorum]|nr:hypothetical protein [Icmadophila ericetorum]
MSSPSRISSPLEPRLQSTPGTFPPEPEPFGVISSQQPLFQAIRARRAEYTTAHKIRVKVGTWNVASLSGTERDIGGWFVQGQGVSETLSGFKTDTGNEAVDNVNKSSSELPEVESVVDQEERRTKKQSTIPKNDPGAVPGGDEIGLYVLGLQEIVDIGSVTEAIRPYSDPHPARKWKKAIEETLPNNYVIVAEQQLIGLFLLIYASPTVAPTVSSVSTTSVGTGLMGYMGNKGAVTARIVLGDTTRMTFINCHLAAGTEKGAVERRNWDASQVLSRTRFEPIHEGDGIVDEFGEGIGDEDFAFWFGDLNYRIDDLPGEDVRRLLMLHTRNEYDIEQASKRKIDAELGSLAIQDDERKSHESLSEGSATTASSTNTRDPHVEEINPESDPASLQTTISSLLPHDQLYKQMRFRKAFHDGWREGQIKFLPTYKYDVGSVGMFDSSEKKRGPSWCDRILYRTRRDRLEYVRKAREEEETRKNRIDMKARGLDDAVEEDMLYEYDPDKDGADDEFDYQVNGDAESKVVEINSGYEDRLQLEYYTSHQRVLSSDHKPLDAVFILNYDAVDLVLKAKVQEEVARELDKAENEGRPRVSVVVDRQDHDGSQDGLDEGINYGDIRYDIAKTRNVTIANVGRVPATVGFVGRPNEQGQERICPPWMEIRFDRPSDNSSIFSSAVQQFTVEPGDIINVEVIVHIKDIAITRSLNENTSKIEDVLILRVKNGRDHFLPVRGRWLQSAFGRAIDKLLRMPEGGARKLQHQHPNDSSHKLEENSVQWSAPREVLQLIQALEDSLERALAERGMRHDEGDPPWAVIGWPFRNQSSTIGPNERRDLKSDIREALDMGQDLTFPTSISTIPKVELLADVLLSFLDSIDGGIVPEYIWIVIEKGLQDIDKLKEPLTVEYTRGWILDILSAAPTHSLTFTMLTFMLGHLAHELAPLPVEINHPAAKKDPHLWAVREDMLEEKYAEIFAGILIKVPVSENMKERKVLEGNKRRVVKILMGG